MDEEKKEEPKEEHTTDNSGERVQSETNSLLDRANETAQRLEEANKKTEELLNRQEQLMAKEALGGRSEAGKGSIKKEEISDEEFANKVLKGEINPLGI